MSEQTTTTQPTTEVKDPVKELATRASTFMDKSDVVRVSQAKAYAEILGEQPFAEGGLFEGVSVEDAVAYANKTKAVPADLKQKVRDAYAELKPSYQWLKAFVATAIAINDPELLGHRVAKAEAEAPQGEATETVNEVVQDTAQQVEQASSEEPSES